MLDIKILTPKLIYLQVIKNLTCISDVDLSMIFKGLYSMMILREYGRSGEDASVNIVFIPRNKGAILADLRSGAIL